MDIRGVIWLAQFVEKLESKHNVSTSEVEDVLLSTRWIRRVQRGDVRGEDLYVALGQTQAGRYLAVFFVWKKSGDVLPISARDMDRKERRLYARGN
ncbi:MAG: BrnT family toxin [Caldilineae bacterium]|nr:MAG: BrnT family toxin [Caldilineae bacterium]